MKTKFIVLIIAVTASLKSISQAFDISGVTVEKNIELNELVFTIKVEGIAGDSVSAPIGSLDGAPVLGYVFPTTLNSYDVGFDTTEGIVALALTSHPDFDDTPLWDENLDADFSNDGIVWHSHWVLLVEDPSVSGGLSVKATHSLSILPPTNPGMPMYMDSPGFQVSLQEDLIRCTVPLSRINNQSDFNYDGVAAYMQVNTSDSSLPLLGVYDVYSIASGDLSLPYSVGIHSCDTLFLNLNSTSGIGSFSPASLKLFPNPASTEVHLEMSSDFELDSYKITFTTIAGATVYEAVISTTEMIVPISSIGASGTYVVNITGMATGEILASKKLIVQ